MSTISGANYFKTCDVVHSMKDNCRYIDTISRIARLESMTSDNWADIVNKQVC